MQEAQIPWPVAPAAPGREPLTPASGRCWFGGRHCRARRSQDVQLEVPQPTKHTPHDAKHAPRGRGRGRGPRNAAHVLSQQHTACSTQHAYVGGIGTFWVSRPQTPNSPNYTELSLPNRTPWTGNPPSRCLYQTPAARWAGGTKIWTIHGRHLERQNAQDGLAMTRRR
jgi:hypothetical protein